MYVSLFNDNNLMTRDGFLANCAKQWNACPNPGRYMVIVADDNNGKIGIDGLWCEDDIEVLTEEMKDVCGTFKGRPTMTRKEFLSYCADCYDKNKSPVKGCIVGILSEGSVGSAGRGRFNGKELMALAKDINTTVETMASKLVARDSLTKGNGQ
jgi:hypothetical protein